MIKIVNESIFHEYTRVQTMYRIKKNRLQLRHYYPVAYQRQRVKVFVLRASEVLSI